MKILVDEIPKSPCQCPFVSFKDSEQVIHMCKIGYLVCRIGEPDFQCPFFKGDEK